MLTLFISFQHQQRLRAIWLAEELRRGGYSVIIEDDFGASSPRTEMALGIQRSDVVIALVTPGYAESRATHRELDFAEAYGREVVAVFTGLPSRSSQALPYRAYRRLELQDDWQDRDDQWQALLVLLQRLLLKESERRTSEPPTQSWTPELEQADLPLPDEAVLLYDLEDRAIAQKLLRLHPGWKRANSLGNADLRNDVPRLFLWTAASVEPFSLMRRELDRITKDMPVLLLLNGDLAEPPSGYPTIAVGDIAIHDLRRPDGATLSGDAAREQVERLLASIWEENQRTPLDVFVDRFCCSGDVANLAEQAYDLAVRELPIGETLRLQAVYCHALALRFYGDWRTAVDITGSELTATREGIHEEGERLRLRLLLERISLEYELGDRHVEGVTNQINEVRVEFRRLGDLQAYVQASRVLGNVLREQGDFDGAERILQRTIGVAEYLAEYSSDGGPGELMLADCHRELAVLYNARRDTKRARSSLSDARTLLEAAQGATGWPTQYLSAVLLYVEATFTGHDEMLMTTTAPFEGARSAIETLSRFENPIRVASVYDWLGRAWTRQVPTSQEDLLRAKEYLRKALRIREAHGHRYTLGLSHLSLGQLYKALGQIDESISECNMARQIFNQRGLKPALAKAHAALARAYLEKSRRGGEQYDGLYRQHLAQAEAAYREIQLSNEGLELRFELEHSGRHSVDAVADDTPLVAVGEYLLHEWIRTYSGSQNPDLDRRFDVLVGIGDDAAVIASKGIESDHGLVFTTDAAPGSTAQLTRPPEYVGRLSVVQTLADVLAMGAKPIGILLNLFLQRAVTVGYAKRVIEAVVQEAKRYGVPLLGGDIKERFEQSVGCVAIGFVHKGRILTRDAARPGHVVGITLAADPSGVGHRLIGRRWAQELIEQYRMDSPSAIATFPELAQIIDPDVKYDLLYLPDQVVASAVKTGHMCAAMDTSDGVLACLEILGKESGVDFELDEQMILPIIDDRVQRLAKILEVPPALFMFSAGHDWEIVFTCEEQHFQSVASAVEQEGRGNGSVARIGTVVESQSGRKERSGVVMRRLDGSCEALPYYTDEKFVPRNYQDRPSQWLSFADRMRGPFGEGKVQLDLQR